MCREAVSEAPGVPDRSRREISAGNTMRQLQATCYLSVLCSGAAALTLEVLWQRQLFLVLGASAAATTAVLTALFLGIAVGSLLVVRLSAWISRPLRWLAAVELGIGIWGILVPVLLLSSEPMYRQLATSLPEGSAAVSVLRFVLSVFLLLPATLGMGATIPLMVAALPDRIRQRPAAIYGFNTAGAVAGSLLCGLLLIRWFGISGSYPAALLLSLAAAGFALAAARLRPEAVPQAVAAVPEVIAPPRGLMWGYFAVGWAALGLEVIWLRFLGIVNTNSSVTFALGLAAYLSGMSVGSLLVYPQIVRRSSAQTAFCVACLGAALVTLLTFPVVFLAPWLNYHWITVPAAAGTLAWSDLLLTETLLTTGLMFPPAVFLGMVFPAVCGCASGPPAVVHAWVARAGFIGTLGSVCGILTVSLLMIPAFGLHLSLGLLVATLAAVGMGHVFSAASFPAGRRRLQICAGFCLVGVLIVVADSRPALREFTCEWKDGRWIEQSVSQAGDAVSEIVRFSAGPTGTVIVKKKPGGDHLVYVDDQLVASTNMEARVDSLMLAHLPLLLHPDPQNELTVGFGTGGTSYAITTHGIDAWCVEIEPEVPRAAALLQDQNSGVVQDPRFHLILNDARDHLAISPRQYDVIATDVTNLQYRQNSSLYTREYFQRMQERLSDGGIACAWIPMAAITTPELQTLIHTFQDVFPHTSLWFMNQTHTNFGILIGTPTVLQVDFQRLQRGMQRPEVSRNLGRIGITDPFQILHSLLLDADGCREFCRGAELHTDDNPVLEFSSPLSFYRYNDTFRDNLQAVLRYRPRDLRYCVTGLPADRDAEMDAHQLAADCFCRVLVQFYEFLIARGNGDTTAAMLALRDSLPLAEQGLEALPGDRTREQFYVDFLEFAEQWVNSQSPTR